MVNYCGKIRYLKIFIVKNIVSTSQTTRGALTHYIQNFDLHSFVVKLPIEDKSNKGLAFINL